MERREGKSRELQLARSATVEQTPRELLDGPQPKPAVQEALFRHSQQRAADAVTNPCVTYVYVAPDSRLDPESDAVDHEQSLNEICVCELAASVVWKRRRRAGNKSFEGGLQLHGVHFTRSNAQDKSRIHALFRRIVNEWVDRLEARRILAGASLVDVFRPTASEFDLLLSALAGELDQLGKMMLKATGREVVTNHNRQFK